MPNTEKPQNDEVGLSFEELMRLHKAHMEGMQRGRELAIQEYDKAFVELSDKMDHIIRKLDKVLEERER